MYAAVQQSDSTTPLKEPRRTGLALTGIFRHAVTKTAREQSEYGDMLKLGSQLLASYICIHDGLAENEVVKKIADAASPNVSENATLRQIETRLNLHA